uniref:Uncharacterized protein n=1 Tax=Steinernema glaseri TaxID=37863 RepID=A0A1I7YU13_9BILA
MVTFLTGMQPEAKAKKRPDGRRSSRRRSVISETESLLPRSFCKHSHDQKMTRLRVSGSLPVEQGSDEGVVLQECYVQCQISQP